MPQNLEAGHLGKIQVDDDNVRQARIVDLGGRLDGFLTILAVLDQGQDALRPQSFLHQKDVGIVVFGDENLRGLAWIYHPSGAVQRPRKGDNSMSAISIPERD